MFGVLAILVQIQNAKNWRVFIADRDNERAERLVAKARKSAVPETEQDERETYAMIQLLAKLAGALLVVWLLVRLFVRA
ncbi:MAG: hypothetical protein QM759_03330 [Terricaulis sp.]